MVKSPGKSNKPPRDRTRKRSSPASNSEGSLQSLSDIDHESLHNDELARSLEMSGPAVSRLPDPASHYPPAYRDDGGQSGGHMTGGGGFSHMQQQQHHTPGQNGLGVMGQSPVQAAPSPMQFHPPPPKSMLENGFNHVGSMVEKDIYSRTLEQNAQLILQVQQAMAENRPDIANDLMNQLGKNIHFLSAAAAADSPTPNSSSSSPVAPAPLPTPSLSSLGGGGGGGPSGESQGPPPRISQSPLPVRPHSQPTPPHVSPPPNFQPISNGQPYGSPSSATSQSSYAPYGVGPPVQARPQPVYSPLAQSTQGPGYSPKSPNIGAVPPFPGTAGQAQQSAANGYMSSRPVYQPPQQTQSFPPQTQPQMASPGQMQQAPSSSPMPPPQNYPYPPQSRGSSYAPAPQGYAGGYQPQEPPTDPNFTTMPPPQMQPKRSGSGSHRSGMTSIPPGPVPDQRQQLMYQQRSPYPDSYNQQQQQQQMQLQQQQQHQQQPAQGPQQHYLPGPPATHHPMNPMMGHAGNSSPVGQYHMQQGSPGSHQQGQFRAPAPPGSPYGSPSPGGAGGGAS